MESIGRTLDEFNLDVSRSSDSRSWKKVTEMITFGTEDEIFRCLHQHFGGEDTFTLKRLDHVVNRMITFGDYEYVKDYIRTSPEVKLFLHDIDEEDNSALVLTACEKYLVIIKFLFGYRVNVDHQNKDGRSPLMKAAFWGRIDNVKQLLEHDVNRNLYDIHGRQTAEFAGLSLRNDEERYQLSGREVQMYREVTFIANQVRRVILELLKDSKKFFSRGISIHDQVFQVHSFRKTDRGTIELITPVAEFHVPNE